MRLLLSICRYSSPQFDDTSFPMMYYRLANSLLTLVEADGASL